jgi:hypothetical protein
MSKRAVRAIVSAAAAIGSVGAWVGGGGSVANAAAPAAAEGGPSQQELMDQINALKAQVDRLQATQQSQQDRLTAAEVDATVDSVLRDADRRSQLLQAQGFTAGYDKGKFKIQSEDGNFVLNPNIQLQARYVYNYREEDAADTFEGDATNESGFEIRRMKLAFEGNVFSPNTKYKFQWATNRAGGALTLEEAAVSHRFGESPYAVKFGQYKDVTFHEEITSSKRQLAVDRSMANEQLAGGITDYIQGVAVVWDDGAEGLPLRGEFGYTDGPNSDNTNFVDGGGSANFGVANPDYGAYGRLAYLAMGDWKAYDDFTAMKNTSDLLVLGAGAFYAEAGGGNAIFHTVDAQAELMGRLGLYAAYYGVRVEPGDDGGEPSYDLGGVAQAGYMLTDKLEGFGRYSLVKFDDAGDDEDTFNEFTAGVNYYFSGHAAKLTVDAVWLPDGAPSNDTGIGQLDPDADEEQFMVRGQFQLLL